MVQTRPIAWLNRLRPPAIRSIIKTPPTSEDCRQAFHAFTPRKATALRKKRRGTGFVPGILFVKFSSWNSIGGILLRFHATYPVGDDGEGRASLCRFHLTARTRAGRIHSAHWPRSSRNILRARVRTSAGFP